MKYYHATRRRGPYFEGWYLKCLARDGQALAMIPALHIDHSGRRSASLQVISDHGTWHLDYPAAEFRAAEKQFCLRVGRSVFSGQGASVHARQEDFSLDGSLCFAPFRPLRSDIMGPFRFLPGMECYHGVLSMGHPLEGALTLNGRTIDFSGGTGYVETDRGRSFPSAYLWAQCAWQGTQSGSLMLSIASIPLAAGSFTGCICAVLCAGREYRLATYRGVRIERWSKHGAVIRQGKYRLSVEVLESHGRPLRAPMDGAMNRTIHESLCARLRFRFWDGRQLLIDHEDDRASFEYAVHP